MKQCKLLSLLAVVAILVTACAAPAAPQVIEKEVTKVVKEVVKETVVVEKVVTATPEPAPKEATILLASDTVSLDPDGGTTQESWIIFDSSMCSWLWRTMS